MPLFQTTTDLRHPGTGTIFPVELWANVANQNQADLVQSALDQNISAQDLDDIITQLTAALAAVQAARALLP